jgi:hypothetical protein
MAAMEQRLRPTPAKPAPTATPARPAPGGSPAAPVRSAGPTPAQAIAMQRTVGNRAAARTLSRWAAHPDKDKKGVLMTDAAAGDYQRFNPPLSK